MNCAARRSNVYRVEHMAFIKETYSSTLSLSVRESTLVGGIENRLGVTHRVPFETKNATICQEFLLSVP